MDIDKQLWKDITVEAALKVYLESKGDKQLE